MSHSVISDLAWFHQLTAECVGCNGSDIHLTGGYYPVIRAHGRLEFAGDDTLSAEKIMQLAEHLLSESQLALYQQRGQVDFGYSDKENNRYRGNLYRERNKPCIALRYLSNEFKSARDLHLPPQVQKLSALRDGLVLITGATGSGKSTTLATLINDINNSDVRHIITIEDPIEFIHEHKQSLVHQRELHTDVDSFASAVRASLREDPDVILVGELRDRETVSAAISAAETGHLVFTTLHTNDAVGAIDRLVGFFPGIEQGVARSRLGLCLRAVVAQQLVPIASGYGRVAALEIMMGTKAVANMVTADKSKQLYSLIESGAADGMQTMDQSLASLARNYTIKTETALRLAKHPQTVEKILARNYSAEDDNGY